MYVIHLHFLPIVCFYFRILQITNYILYLSKNSSSCPTCTFLISLLTLVLMIVMFTGVFLFHLHVQDIRFCTNNCSYSPSNYESKKMLALHIVAAGKYLICIYVCRYLKWNDSFGANISYPEIRRANNYTLYITEFVGQFYWWVHLQ